MEVELIENKRCLRCGDKEFRIHGYCSVYCKDMHELEEIIEELESKIEELESKLNDRENVDISRIEEFTYKFLDILDLGQSDGGYGPTIYGLEPGRDRIDQLRAIYALVRKYFSC